MTPLARVNPAVKFGGLLLVTLAMTVVFDPVTPAAFLLVALLAGRLLGGIRLRTVLRFLAPFWVAVIGIFLANLLFNRLNSVSPALAYLGPLKVTGVALTTAGSLSLRLLAFACFSLVFVRTTDASELILSTIHQLRLNFRFAFGIMVGYRMLPLLGGEYEQIRAAHRVRGVSEGAGLRGRFRRLKRYAVPLLAGAVRRAGRVAVAMDARAFGAFPTRTYRRRMTVKPGDWFFLAAVVTLTCALLVGLWAAGVTRFGVGV